MLKDQERRNARFISLLALFIAGGFCGPVSAYEVEPYDRAQLLIPEGLDPRMSHALVIALHPTANAAAMLRTWQPVAEKYQWYVLASSEFRNGQPMDASLKQVYGVAQEVMQNHRIDRKKIIVTGLSGGAMGAHAFAFEYPDFVKAVVANTGMMHEYYQKRKYPSSKVCVFLASPTDFRYAEMQRDEKFLQAHRWRTFWIEFEGGHTLAPQNSYLEAVQWLSKMLR